MAFCEFKSLDIEFEEQQTWACATRFASCIEVENLIGFIPGKSDLPYLALMAHYDSVPVAPGAGDWLAPNIKTLFPNKISSI